MNTQKLLNMALNGVDAIGYRLDQYGITGKVNRHNIAAFLAAEQRHLEGEWDSIQAKFDRRRSQVDTLLKPVISRVNQFRGASSN